MRIAVLDCWSGVAGDMWVGAMLDAGVPLAPLAETVASLGLPGVRLAADRVLRAGLSGTWFRVLEGGVSAEHAAEASFMPLPEGRHGGVLRPGATAHVHRGLAEIEAIVGAGAMPAAVRERCLAVYRAIAEVEAEAHGTTVEAVHFHEVGAVDTIVDVVCACLATHLLGVDRIVANGIATGSGTITAAHGVLPVPAPATAALLRGIPVQSGGLAGERTTPTGAALLRTLVDAFDEPVAYSTEAIGYGAGSRDDPAVPNLLRVSVGKTRAATSALELTELTCQLDTASGELVGWLLDEALARGATDAFAVPVQMKKGRPGLLVTVLSDAAHEVALRELLLEESTSLGVRCHRVSRSVLERWQQTRATALGAVEFKVARLPSGAVVARPEDDEVRRLCRELGIGRAEVLRRLLP
ncbi:MAG: nickel pincer cofactor biosynthesis protein LarC [Planctomycetes bacterium]|nr:nickel pincer cofactor biosynthesis protein LarC [Planctomycetota bacterium]